MAQRQVSAQKATERSKCGATALADKDNEIAALKKRLDAKAKKDSPPDVPTDETVDQSSFSDALQSEVDALEGRLKRAVVCQG